MIGFALQLGTNAAAATMVQLAGIGTRQARVMRNLISLPFEAVDAAVEAAFGPRQRPNRVHRLSPAGAMPTAPAALPAASHVRTTPACPDEEMLAAYADHALLPEEQVRVENHLVDCENCRFRVALAVGVPAPEEACTAYHA